MNTDICIIGTGPAGMVAAITATSAEPGLKVLVVEAGSAPGRKLLVTGGARCNVTNLSQPRQFLADCKPFDKFLRHCIHEFPPTAVIEFLSSIGVETKVMEKNNVFPVSERSAEVNNALFDRAKSLGVKFVFATKADSIAKTDDGFVIESGDKRIDCRSLIIATGGCSWPQTGSDGSGFVLAKSLGHKIIPPRPCLVPLITVQIWPNKIPGICLDEVVISAKIESKKIASSGALVFTQTGISGPAVLDISRKLLNIVTDFPAEIKIDLLPHINSEQIEKKLTDAIAGSPKKIVATVISELLPTNLAVQLCKMVDVEKMKMAQLSKPARKKLLELLKRLPLTIKAAAPIAIATVTRGGVDNAEINPLTMSSKLYEKLFFAGEIINADGPCGGYNLQIAFSSGLLAGKNAVKD